MCRLYTRKNWSYYSSLWRIDKGGCGASVAGGWTQSKKERKKHVTYDCSGVVLLCPPHPRVFAFGFSPVGVRVRVTHTHTHTHTHTQRVVLPSLERSHAPSVDTLQIVHLSHIPPPSRGQLLICSHFNFFILNSIYISFFFSFSHSSGNPFRNVLGVQGLAVSLRDYPVNSTVVFCSRYRRWLWVLRCSCTSGLIGS